MIEPNDYWFALNQKIIKENIIGMIRLRRMLTIIKLKRKYYEQDQGK